MPPTSKPKRPWQEVASEAQAYRNSTISALFPPAPEVPPKLPKNVLSLPTELLSPKVISITNLPPEQLLTLLCTGRVSAVDVTTAYLQRAAVAQGLVNCLTELLATQALGRARELDDYFQTNKAPIGPLHGLPISIKEHVGLEGLRCTTGYVSHWDNIAKEDAHILTILRKAGAVFHCRTTIPQTMMHLETDSVLYGVTNNPYNSSLSSGGSSGGEGALLALHGSCLGIGSDVGGSIRNPAANCGVYGIKPTAFRVPTDGWGYIMAGADSVESVLGPMSTSLSGLKLFMKTVLDSEPWLTEPALIPFPWRNFELPKDRPLRIGILWDDQIVKPHPPITRALKMFADRAQRNGIEVIDFKPYLHDEAWAIIASLYFTDGGEADGEAINSSGEPWRPLSEWIITQNPCVKKLDVGELTYWLEEREAYRKEYALHWNSLGVDAVLCPVGPGVAPKHNTSKYWWYTSQWNLLDYPAVAFPVTKVDNNIDKLDANDRSLSAHDSFNRELWDPEEFHGLPVSLQLVGRRFEDEKVLGILEHVTQLIGLPFEEFP
ncbi:amidase [Bimuria novae-zelandiae CBS 107.79]|uniref:amidase n=1 Tax=Bimuria novae-zelandiae CBS 107.79 TaxID=1447943 RepID=A0A6A5UR98_9PLEO|nr:amidase [Bimuria novae-zelandiae CBS 107.79]